MSELDKSMKILDWDERLKKFDEEESSCLVPVIISFMIGLVLGLAITQYLVPWIMTFQ